MTDATEFHSQFLNGRDWRSFLTAVQSTVNYPKMMEVLRSRSAWFSDGAARTSNWRLSNGSLAERLLGPTGEGIL
jgi:hypothetical protein